MNAFTAAIAATALALSTFAAEAHEFWIDPVDFTPGAGAPIVADLRVGQLFDGTSYSYLPNTYRRFDIIAGGETLPVEGRPGDRPALNQAPGTAGLVTVVHVTRDMTLTYREFAKFEEFVRHKDAPWVLEAHAARGLPETDFVEAYSRYAKSLVAAGGTAGADTEAGLLTEITALANPYADDLEGGLPVRVTYKGAPRAEAQVEIFEKAPGGAVTVSTVRTDAAGEARVPVRPGYVYMLDSVVLREPEGEMAKRPDVVWESLWANLTFAVPAR